MHPFFFYLIEASVGLAVFAAIYRLFLYRLTHFAWNRVFLLGSLLLSLSLPLLPLSFFSSSNPWSANSANLFPKLNLGQLNPMQQAGNSPGAAEEPATGAALPYHFIGYLLMGIYGIGFLYKAFRFSQNLKSVLKLIQGGEQLQDGNYCLVHTQQTLPAFSFLHYIFLDTGSKALSEEELAQVIKHEQVHVDQKHSLDLLLFEIAGMLLWFNPAINYLGTQIREVHEYQVDAQVSRSSGNIRKYGELLIKLASQRPFGTPLLNAFSSQQIFHRITMLTQTKSNPMQKLRFLAILPATVLIVALSSFLGNDKQQSTAALNTAGAAETATSAQEVTVRKISWEGNAAYTDEQLSQALKLKAGDPYKKEDLNSLLNYNPDGTDISSLYMDHGYLFFQVIPKETFTGNTVDLAFTLIEGPQARIGELRVAGNTKISTAELLDKINIKKGELFSRSKLIAAQKAILNTGYFNPETMGINPIPNPEAGTVDIEFDLKELK